MVGDIVRNLWFLGTGYLMKRNKRVTNFKQQVGLGNSYCNYLFSINLSKNKYYGNCCFCCQNICVVSVEATNNVTVKHFHGNLFFIYFKRNFLLLDSDYIKF